MSEEKVNQFPLSLAVISVFCGFLAFMSLMAAGEDYIFFSLVLPKIPSIFLSAVDATVLGFISIGLLKKSKLARKVLIYYCYYAISDILITLMFIDKKVLLEMFKDAKLVYDFANINLFFCIIFFFLIRFARNRKELFVN